MTILASQEFAVYEPTGISVVATEVRMVFDTGSVSSPDNSIAGAVTPAGGMKSPDQAGRAAAAVATAAPLLAFTILLAIIAAWGRAAASAAESLNVGDWPPVLDASWITIALTVFLVLFNIGVPVAALIGSLRVPFSPPKMLNEFGPQVHRALNVASKAALIAC